VNISLDAQPRTDFGKGAARRLRREGRIPAVLYGGTAELVHVSLPAHELEQALRKPMVTLEIVEGSTKTLTKPRDIQRDPVKRSIEHVDLIVVSASEARERAAEAEVLVAEAAAAAEAAANAPMPSGPAETSEAATDGAAADDAGQESGDAATED